jgi:hypothetical protein
MFWLGSAAPSRATEVSNDRLHLSYFKLDVRSLSIQQADVRISTKAQEPLKLKRSARDKIKIK